MSSVADTFTRVADGYDRLNRILSLGMDVVWRRRALVRLRRLLGEGADRPLAILDLATGAAVYVGTDAVDCTPAVKTKLGIK